jgi:hypothetical protein
MVHIQNIIHRAVEIIGAKVVLCTRAHAGGFRAHTAGGGGAGAYRNLFALLGPLPPLQNLLENQEKTARYWVHNMRLRCIKEDTVVLRQNVASHNVYVTKRNCY